MWNNSYWSTYWADRYWAPVGADGGTPPATDETIRNLVLGIGPMGKVRVHHHPVFNRTKQ